MLSVFVLGEKDNMKELKYTYALDKNGLCVEIHNDRSGVKYYCPHCDAEMVVKDVSTFRKIYPITYGTKAWIVKDYVISKKV